MHQRHAPPITEVFINAPCRFTDLLANPPPHGPSMAQRNPMEL